MSNVHVGAVRSLRSVMGWICSMLPSETVKIVVFVPETHAEVVREAMGKAGAGKIGNYSCCTFSSKGIGRFKPEQGAHPSVGRVGEMTSVNEERIETVCPRNKLEEVVKAIQAVHPYEEVALDIYALDGYRSIDSEEQAKAVEKK